MKKKLKNVIYKHGITIFIFYIKEYGLLIKKIWKNNKIKSNNTNNRIYKNILIKNKKIFPWNKNNK